MRITTALLLASLLGACGGDDDDVSADGDADTDADADGDGDADGDADASVPDAGADAGPEPSGCPPPPDDLPTDVTITEDGRYRYLDEFAFADLPPRAVTVYVPAGYDDEPERRYPVVYMFDGQEVFGVSQADVLLDAAVEAGTVPPHILVGVNATNRRLYEMTPGAFPEGPPEIVTEPGGGGDELAALIVDVIKPYVDAHFRTRCGRENTTISGYSLGGLMCMYMLLRDPDVFGRGICMSASYWWRNGEQVQALRDFAGPMPVRLWLDVGTLEAREFRDLGFSFLMVGFARDARDAAIAKGMELGTDLGYFEQPDRDHEFQAAAERLPISYPFVLSDEPGVGEADADGFDVHLFEETLSAPAAGDLLGACDLSVTLSFGDALKLTWPNLEATLSSDAESVATVDETGRVTAVSDGIATITAHLGDHTGADTIEVR